MHELGIVVEIAKTVENFAKSNNLTKVDTIVLQIGAISTVVPQYIEECYPAAIDGGFLQDTKLKIEILPANAMCKACSKIYNLVENKGVCPGCGDKAHELLSGKEFMIKEIIAC